MTLEAHRQRGTAARMNENSPWGNPGDSNSNSDGGKGSGGPSNPWSRPSGGGPSGGDPRGPSALEELLRRARSSFGEGLPGGPDRRSLWFWLAIGVGVLWLATTSVHRIGPQERGLVTFFGSFSRTLTPGISFTLPAPLEAVKVIDVEEIRTIDIGSGGDDEKLMVTGDQNLIDLAYSVRWNIRSPEMYVFEIAEADKTISEVAESAMRAVIGTVSLDEALGAGRTMIEQQVRERMQDILDRYHSGVQVQGIAIKQADPPAAVNDAFKEVSAAQQTAQTYLNEAHAYAQQLRAKAEGEAAAFDKVYVQYKLSPEVTRRRMYYETMEQVLSGVDKTIVETNNVTPYLPLPEVGKRSTAAQRASSAAESGQ